jgi:iron(III) transport system permease protein
MLMAAGIVFVDVLKELPATLIVRPFNFDTLAVRVYQLASDERLSEAATGSLVIVAVALVPIILVNRVAIGRDMNRSRHGAMKRPQPIRKKSGVYFVVGCGGIAPESVPRTV